MGVTKSPKNIVKIFKNRLIKAKQVRNTQIIAICIICLKDCLCIKIGYNYKIFIYLQ